MKIVMVSGESNPLYKTGGLGDVVYSLSKELVTCGEEVSIFLPYYKTGADLNYQFEKVGELNIFMSWRKQYCGIYKGVINGITYYLIDNEFYFKREKLYGWGDDYERFAFFSLAVLESMMVLNLCPDIIHVHDWQVGMIPCLLKEFYSKKTVFFRRTKTVITLHNPAFKGFMDKYCLNNLYGLNDRLYENGSVRFDGQVSSLKAGITYADIVTTVSPTYRNELMQYATSQGFKYVLELREEDFFGIINGIDEEEFNPKNDEYLVRQYNTRSFVLGKLQNKRDVYEQFGLRFNHGPLFVVISRLTDQKGIDLIIKLMPEIAQANGCLFVLGSGDSAIESQLLKLRDSYKNKVGLYLGYSNELAHKLYAAADFLLMPSQFEPCGISQMIAQKYATLPIVRETGGLKDTVVGYRENNLPKATGFSFVDYNEEGLKYAIDLAVKTYYDKDILREIMANAITLDNSWKKPAKRYLEIYRKALSK